MEREKPTPPPLRMINESEGFFLRLAASVVVSLAIGIAIVALCIVSQRGI